MTTSRPIAVPRPGASPLPGSPVDPAGSAPPAEHFDSEEEADFMAHMKRGDRASSAHQ